MDKKKAMNVLASSMMYELHLVPSPYMNKSSAELLHMGNESMLPELDRLFVSLD